MANNDQPDNRDNNVTSTQPLVSVIVPAFNAANTIKTAVDSVLAQTLTNLEVVICDDASTDGTETHIQAFSDPRVRLLRNPYNLGQGAARDKAISVARGDWIAVLDADDAWHPQRLETLIRAAGTAKGFMVFDDILICHHTSKGMQPWRAMRGPKAFGASGDKPVDVPTAAWAGTKHFLIKPLIPRATLKNARVKHSTLLFAEDTEFFLRLIAAGLQLRYVPNAYYYYRITPGSLSATPQRAKLMRDMLESILPLFSDDTGMQRALMRKITYRDFTIALKTRNWASLFQLIRNKPSLLKEFSQRVATEMPYVLDRFLHRGSSRGQPPMFGKRSCTTKSDDSTQIFP